MFAEHGNWRCVLSDRQTHTHSSIAHFRRYRCRSFECAVFPSAAVVAVRQLQRCAYIHVGHESSPSANRAPMLAAEKNNSNLKFRFWTTNHPVASIYRLMASVAACLLRVNIRWGYMLRICAEGTRWALPTHWKALQNTSKVWMADYCELCNAK